MKNEGMASPLCKECVVINNLTLITKPYQNNLGTLLEIKSPVKYKQNAWVTVTKKKQTYWKTKKEN